MTDALPPDSIRTIRRTLNAILRKTPVANREVALIFDLLDGAPPSAEFAAGVDVASAAPGVAKRYVVRETDGEMRLSESREDGGAPFTVPESVYRAFSAAAAAHSGKKYDYIFRKVSQQAGNAARDYHGRVVFRFWQSRGLLVKDRSRYAIVGPKETFAERAREAWAEVKARGDS